MAGRHSKRQRTRAQVPVQRRTGIELVDALTRLAYLVSLGDFVAFCGTGFVAAALVEPGRGRCAECRGE